MYAKVDTSYEGYARSREGVILHRPEDWEPMRRAGSLAARTLDYIQNFIKPGVTTDELDQLCADFMTSHGGITACLNYKGFPKNVCVSVNEVICHGIPGPRILQEGDIVNVDVTVILDGWHGDSSRTWPVGKAPAQARRLMQVAQKALMKGIAQVRPGAFVGDIGHAIQTYVEDKGFSVVYQYCGHGVGKVFHMAPQIVHVGEPGTGIRLEEGMFLTIEPMVNEGVPEAVLMPDKWTVITKDRKRSAQYEHTLGVTADGYEIFTL